MRSHPSKSRRYRLRSRGVALVFGSRGRLFAARADGRPGEPRSIPVLGPAAGRAHELPTVRVQP